MSIEWFNLMEAPRRLGRKSQALEDPLNGEDWQRLGWAMSAIAYLIRQSVGMAAPQKHRKPPIGNLQADAEGRICV